MVTNSLFRALAPPAGESLPAELKSLATPNPGTLFTHEREADPSALELWGLPLENHSRVQREAEFVTLSRESD